MTYAEFEAMQREDQERDAAYIKRFGFHPDDLEAHRRWLQTASTADILEAKAWAEEGKLHAEENLRRLDIALQTAERTH